MGGPGSGRRPGGGKSMDRQRGGKYGKGIKTISGDTFHPPLPWVDIKLNKHPGRSSMRICNPSRRGSRTTVRNAHSHTTKVRR